MIYSELLSKFGAISFQAYVSKGITHPVFYGDLVYKLKRIKEETNFISSGSKIVKRLWRRQYDPVIKSSSHQTQYDPVIKRTIGMWLALLQPSTDPSLSVALWLTKRLGLYDGSCLNLLWGDRVLIPVPFTCQSGLLSIWTWARVQTARSTAYFNGCPYIFLIYYYITSYVCVQHFYDLSALFGCWSSVSIRRIIYNFFLDMCPFDNTAVAVRGRLGARKPV